MSAEAQNRNRQRSCLTFAHELTHLTSKLKQVLVLQAKLTTVVSLRSALDLQYAAVTE